MCIASCGTSWRLAQPTLPSSPSSGRAPRSPQVCSIAIPCTLISLAPTSIRLQRSPSHSRCQCLVCMHRQGDCRPSTPCRPCAAAKQATERRGRKKAANEEQGSGKTGSAEDGGGEQRAGGRQRRSSAVPEEDAATANPDAERAQCSAVTPACWEALGPQAPNMHGCSCMLCSGMLHAWLQGVYMVGKAAALRPIAACCLARASLMRGDCASRQMCLPVMSS